MITKNYYLIFFWKCYFFQYRIGVYVYCLWFFPIIRIVSASPKFSISSKLFFLRILCPFIILFPLVDLHINQLQENPHYQFQNGLYEFLLLFFSTSKFPLNFFLFRILCPFHYFSISISGFTYQSILGDPSQPVPKQSVWISTSLLLNFI